MTLGRCIPELLAEGKLTPEQAQRASDLYEARKRHFEGRMSPEAADAAASEAAVRELERAAMLRERQTVLQLKAQKRMVGDMASYGGGQGEGPIDPRAAIAMLDRDGRAPYSNVEARRKVIVGQAHRLMDRLLREHSRNVVGEIRQKAQLRDIVSELFGRNSGNANARELADSWSQAAEMLRQRFNSAGGAIAKLERWGLPQSHNALKARQAGEEEWISFTMPLLDRARMVDRETGLPLNDAELRTLLQDVWETVRTEGWANRNPGGRAGSKLANQRQEHRVLHFAGPDEWTAYADRFGSGNAFDAMMAHIEHMSRDIALMEVLGPNPDASVRWLKDSILKSAQLDSAAGSESIDRAKAGAKKIDKIYRELTGANMEPQSRRVAAVGSALRSYQTYSKLGGAALSAVTDLGFQVSARRFAGLPAVNVLGDYLKLLNPAAAEDRLLAVRLGLIAEQWSTMASGTHRFLMEELTSEWTRRLAEFTLRASGLSAWTQAGRWGFGKEFLGFLTDQSTRSFDQLRPNLRATFERYGIGAAEWDKIRSTPLEEERGVPWIMPHNIQDRSLGDRVLEMVLTETDFAVPVADLNARAAFSEVTPRGTLLGETFRSMLQFKSFGFTVAFNQANRLIEQTSWAQRANVMIGFLIPVVMMGGFATVLKDVSKGRDPRPMNDERFWGKAFAQSGGSGLVGDFFAASTDEYGGGLLSFAAGPTFGDLQQLADIAKGDPERRAAKVAKLLRNAVPGTNLWYTRLAFDRMVADQLQAEIDPQYRDSWKRLDRFAAQWGQEYWWAPGETSPARAPDFANAFQGEIPEDEE
jgi:hypothetical protein